MFDAAKLLAALQDVDEVLALGEKELSQFRYRQLQRGAEREFMEGAHVADISEHDGSRRSALPEGSMLFRVAAGRHWLKLAEDS